MNSENWKSRGSINIGDQYGRLTCLEFVEKRDQSNYFLFQCKCGNTCIKKGTVVKSGSTRSCGCLAKEVQHSETTKLTLRKATDKVKLPHGESACRKMYKVYKQRALDYGHSFTLTMDTFKFFTKQKCFYCGQKPTNRGGYKNDNGYYWYNGIDRMDNNKGYEPSNCVPCCRRCNIAKNDLDYVEFIQLIKNIYLRHAALINKSKGFCK